MPRSVTGWASDHTARGTYTKARRFGHLSMSPSWSGDPDISRCTNSLRRRQHGSVCRRTRPRARRGSECPAHSTHAAVRPVHPPWIDRPKRELALQQGELLCQHLSAVRQDVEVVHITILHLQAQRVTTVSGRCAYTPARRRWAAVRAYGDGLQFGGGSAKRGDPRCEDLRPVTEATADRG